MGQAARTSERAVSHRSAQGRVAVMSAAEISACSRSDPGKAAPVFTSTERLALSGFLALHHPVHHRAPRKRSLIAYDYERSARTAQRGKPAALVADQSWRVSMNTGICRVALAWNSPTEGASATSFGHSPARAGPSSSSATTVNVWVPTSALILGLALRL